MTIKFMLNYKLLLVNKLSFSLSDIHRYWALHATLIQPYRIGIIPLGQLWVNSGLTSGLVRVGSGLFFLIIIYFC